MEVTDIAIIKEIETIFISEGKYIVIQTIVLIVTIKIQTLII